MEFAISDKLSSSYLTLRLSFLALVVLRLDFRPNLGLHDQPYTKLLQLNSNSERERELLDLCSPVFFRYRIALQFILLLVTSTL